MVDGSVVEVFGGDDFLDDLFKDFFSEFLRCDGFAVLGADDDGVDSFWYYGSAVVLVFDCDLRLGIWPEPGKAAVISRFFHGSVEGVGELDGHG